MKFDNTISIADLISIFALVLSFITIIFLFIQRKDSSKIYLSIRDKDKSHIINQEEFQIESLYIKLLGNNVAKNIHMFIELINDGNLIANEWYRTIKQDKLIRICKSIYFDNISPGEILDVSKNFQASLYAVLDAIIFDITKEKELNWISFRNHYVLIKLKYKDINGYNYNQYYKLAIDLNIINYEKKEIDYSINISEISKKTYINSKVIK